MTLTTWEVHCQKSSITTRILKCKLLKLIQTQDVFSGYLGNQAKTFFLKLTNGRAIHCTTVYYIASHLIFQQSGEVPLILIIQLRHMKLWLKCFALWFRILKLNIVGCQHVHIALFKIGSQQGPTVLQRELCSMYGPARMGGKFGEEWIHVYVWLSPFDVHLKLSQHY